MLLLTSYPVNLQQSRQQNTEKKKKKRASEAPCIFLVAFQYYLMLTKLSVELWVTRTPLNHLLLQLVKSTSTSDPSRQNNYTGQREHT